MFRKISNFFKIKKNKYRVAVLFYGHARTFKQTYDSFKKNILDVNKEIDIDIFIHTWDELEHLDLRHQYKKDLRIAGKPLTQEDINFLKNKYKPLKIKIDKQLTFSESQINYIKKKGFNEKSYIANYNISYSISESNRLKNMSQNKYDLIIMTRLDIMFLKPLKLFEALENSCKNKIDFLNFSATDFNNVVFYTYMQSDNMELFRNQNRYITGIDLFLIAGNKAIEYISNWHNKVLNYHPMGVGPERWITKQIKDYNLNLQLMYYSKPDCYIIFRSNTNDLKYEKQMQEIEEAKRRWEYDKVQFLYENIIKNEYYLFEFVRFLADIGKLERIYKLFFIDFGIDVIRKLIEKGVKDSEVGVNMLNFFINIFNPSILEYKDNIESKILYLTYHEDFDRLISLFRHNTNILKKDCGKMQMIINFSLNKMMENNYLKEDLILPILYLYENSKNINQQRKKFVLSSCIEYFDKKQEPLFFKCANSILIGSLLSQMNFEQGRRAYEFKNYQCFRKYHLNNKIDNVKIDNVKIDNVKIDNVKIDNVKIAVCLSGLFRGDIYKVIANLKFNLIDNLNADLFIFTWDRYVQYPGFCGDENWVYRLFGGKFLKKCPDELKTLSFLKQKFPNTYSKLNIEQGVQKINQKYIQDIVKCSNIQIQNEEEFISSLYLNMTSKRETNRIKMFYGIYKSIQMALEYEKINKFRYDYIFRVRPDIGLIGNIEIKDLNKLKNNELAVDFFSYGVQDQFFYAHRNVMIEVAKIWEYCYEKNDIFLRSFDSSHYLLFIYLTLRNILTVKPNFRRDVSLATRDNVFPNVAKELQEDFLKLNMKIENNINIKNFLEEMFLTSSN
ncbi:capsular biosynthesis protein [Campylobacter jejuni]|uniref:Capsular biosynthesis protein n=1 Tax=Campylobacter jejuni TaxID=197 RepID=A0A5T1QYI8_CAMJU|nr:MULTISPECIES: capsular biosynthesis protein [Campylobacter]QQE68987.1 capsular biosynthesis protein [Campylobacter jejuni subsp. jejuni]EAH5950523.1 capsular biosynthesis protein [Campylobacter jejuni]EAH8479892.1 capsular biosynthesis protein [Campylobacter jejuni]EAH8979849.1 capsular biosynthesis protein [Campylobacter jejuni]EAI0281294.1 capsular biosynthesis protein [Campylobacter jejuni]